MKNSFVYYFLLIQLILSATSHASGFLCSSVMIPHKRVEFALDAVNEKYGYKIFGKQKISESFAQKYQNSWSITVWYKSWKLKRLLKNIAYLDRSSEKHALYKYIYKLEKLAFLEAVESNPSLFKDMSFREKAVVSDSRRSLTLYGLKDFMDIREVKPNSFGLKVFQKITSVFSEKYLRWMTMPIYNQKLVGTHLSQELALKILSDGVLANQESIRKEAPYILGPLRNLPILGTTFGDYHFDSIAARAYFNTFSKTYNYFILSSFFTVVPYMTHQFMVEQEARADQMWVERLTPLDNTAKEMADPAFAKQKLKVDYEVLLNESIAKYKAVVKRQDLSAQELAALQSLAQKNAEEINNSIDAQ